MERKFKDMSDSSIKEMIEEINKKNRAGKGDMRDAGILLALEFELDMRKNEGKYVNVEELGKIQSVVKRTCDELKEINTFTMENEKAKPYLEDIKANLQIMEEYINKYMGNKKKIDIDEIG